MATGCEAGRTDRLRVGSLTFEYENGSRERIAGARGEDDDEEHDRDDPTKLETELAAMKEELAAIK